MTRVNESGMTRNTVTSAAPGGGRAVVANPQYGDTQGQHGDYSPGFMRLSVKHGTPGLGWPLSLGSGMRSANARIKEDR
jgi:hypothetical protein